MRIYRVAQQRYASSVSDMLSGEGAAKFGGRWNSVGVPALYCSESLSLCALEILAHLPRGVLYRYHFLAIEIPDEQIIHLAEDIINDTRRNIMQQIGDLYLGSEGIPAFSVPSMVNPLERNIIINPEHPNTPLLSCGSIQPFPMDNRLLQR